MAKKSVQTSKLGEVVPVLIEARETLVRCLPEAARIENNWLAATAANREDRVAHQERQRRFDERLTEGLGFAVTGVDANDVRAGLVALGNLLSLVRSWSR